MTLRRSSAQGGDCSKGARKVHCWEMTCSMCAAIPSILYSVSLSTASRIGIEGGTSETARMVVATVPSGGGAPGGPICSALIASPLKSRHVPLEREKETVWPFFRKAPSCVSKNVTSSV